MPIANYTTEKSVDSTVGDVTKALARRGVTRISTVYDDDGQAAGINFLMKTPYGLREFELPVRTEGVLAALRRDGVAPRYLTRPHAARVAWRIAADWLKAQSALIDAGLAELDEVMLPYMVADGGVPLYTIMRGRWMKELAS